MNSVQNNVTALLQLALIKNLNENQSYGWCKGKKQNKKKTGLKQKQRINQNTSVQVSLFIVTFVFFNIILFYFFFLHILALYCSCEVCLVSLKELTNKMHYFHYYKLISLHVYLINILYGQPAWLA